MRFTMTGLGAALILAATAGAVSAAGEMDTDGDGMYSFNELLVAYPALTEETYGTIDANGDGGIDDAELASALDAGILPAS